MSTPSYDREQFHVAENVTVDFFKVPDMFGFLKDTCEVVVTNEDGRRVVYPVAPPIKVNTQAASDPAWGDSTLRYDYIDAQAVYQRFLERHN